METAEKLSAISHQGSAFPFIFRAGVWKPRSHPDSFQGAGEEGLQWLQEVKQRWDIPVATEVATPEHVRLALQAGIDYLWIGARTSANPIAVEAISHQLSAISELNTESSKLKAVLIKNPVNADEGLWLGNIERFEKTGVPVMAIHRGCGHQPCWSMAHTVRSARPDIPMLLDPSHMSGDAQKVPELMEKMAELGLDGAMIEVHCNPSAALSDAKQQIRPHELLDCCAVRPATPVRQETELNWLRAEIDELDEQLWNTLFARMSVSKRIGEWKKAHDVAPLQPERFQQVLERLKGLQVTGYKLPDELIERVWNAIHEESLKQQE